MPADVSDAVQNAVAEAAKEAGVDLNADLGGEDPQPAAAPDAGEGGETPVEGEGEGGEPTPAAGEGEGEGEGTPAAATTKEEEEELASAEDLAAINADPKLKKVYRGLIRTFNSKTSDLAAKRKEAQTALELVQTLRDHPKEAVRTLVAAVGMKLAEEAAAEAPAPTTPAAKELVDEIREDMEAAIGKEAAAVLAPVIMKAAQKIAGKEIEPTKAKLEANEQAAQRAQLKNGITAFGLQVQEDGGEWNKDVEQAMVDRIKIIRPAEGTQLHDYLRILHNDFLAEQAKKNTTVRQITRIEKAAKGAEPRTPARPATPAAPAIKAGMNEKDAVALAVAESRRELGVR